MNPGADEASNVDLLILEMETLWGTDLYGRAKRPRPSVAITDADDGTAFSFGEALSSDLAESLEQEFRNGESDFEFAVSLPAWYECHVPRSKPVCKGWPAFVFDERPVVPRGFRLLTSNDLAGRPERPEPWGDDAEWEELMGGRLGPWAVSLEGDRTVAVCYTPVASDSAAEAGVWTHPEARRRGHAVAVTAAWANVAWERFETLFYSTSLDNLASQSVARRLGAWPIGCLWQLNLAESS